MKFFAHNKAGKAILIYHYDLQPKKLGLPGLRSLPKNGNFKFEDCSRLRHIWNYVTVN